MSRPVLIMSLLVVYLSNFTQRHRRQEWWWLRLAEIAFFVAGIMLVQHLEEVR